MRIFLILVLVFLVGVLPVRAQSDQTNPPTRDRSYKLLRENEDWSFLRNLSLREHFWDPIKYIALRGGMEDWYLTIGREAREVWEQIGNDNWGQRAYMNGYFNERYMVFASTGPGPFNFMDIHPKSATFCSARCVHLYRLHVSMAIES